MAASLERFGKAVVRCIGTHSGKFHCDDVLAVAMLRVLPECARARLVRSRDEQVLASCDVVVDVGGRYDPSSHRYDHHQREFTETRRSLTGRGSDTRLSSAGLVYHHFGRDVLQVLLQQRSLQDHEHVETQVNGSDANQPDAEQLDLLYERVYTHFVEEVDAVDNGVELYDAAVLEGVRPRYLITSTLSQRVANMNRAWNEAVSEDPSEDDMRRFLKAVDLVRDEFCSCVFRLCDVWLPARRVISQCWRERRLVHASGRLMKLPSGAVPWKEHLFQLEQVEETSKEEQADMKRVHFVIYPDTGAAVEQWRVQAVPPVPGSFAMRTPLMSEWRGLRQEALCKIVGLDDCVFVHSNGFIGGAGSLQSVVHMALESLKTSGALGGV